MTLNPLTLNDVQSLFQEKNKSVADIISTIKENDTIFSKLDEAFALPENSIRVERFNEKMAKYNLYYNPLESEKNKSVAGCTACTSLTGIVVRLCENYGCVVENFVTTTKTDTLNQFIIETVSLIGDDLDLDNPNDQDVSGTAADNTCITAQMKTISVYSRVDKKAIATCTSLDKVALAVERLALKLAKGFDKAILYGKFNGTTYVPVTNFDSIDQLIAAGQKITASGEVDLYKKIVKTIASIQDYTGCDISEIKILVRAGVKTRILGMVDNNDRPVFTELKEAGIDCNTLRIACVNAIPCQSLNQTKNITTGVITSDIFIGYRPHYVFATYEFPAISIYQDPASQQFYRIGNMTSYGGKLVDVNSFYKITATF